MNRNASRLAEMASSDVISYEPNGETRKIGRSVFHGMTATLARDGSTWTYWLAADSGSYRGSFLSGDRS